MQGTNPIFHNISMPEADTEYSQGLPAGTKKFLVHTRDGTAFRLAFVTGKVAQSIEPYFTIPVNSAYNEDFLGLSGVTLYFASSSANLVMEILVWV